jgi:hypothetical protein
MRVLQGADCSSRSCSNCTSTPSCGWCTLSSSFTAGIGGFADVAIYTEAETHGTCIGRGANSKPWCTDCELSYSTAASQCPASKRANDAAEAAAAGGSAANGGSSNTDGTSSDGKSELSSASSGALFGGNKSYQTLFAFFILLLAVLLGAVVYLLVQRHRQAQLIKYKQFEMTNINAGEHAMDPLHVGSPDSEYAPPRASDASAPPAEV